MADKSIFLITSPFQVLCVKEAINHFEIDNYLIVVITSANDNRIKQTKNTLSYFNLVYECQAVKSSSFREIRRIGELILRGDRYSKVFVGDCCDIWLVTLALYVMKFRGNLVYLDDGASSISFFDGNIYSSSYRFKRRCLTLLGLLIATRKPIFFTIFNVKKNCTYCIVHNGFKSLKKDVEATVGGVYIIGTNIDVYCKEYHLSIDEYISSFISVIDKIKNDGNVDYFYIEHGRCINKEIREICNDKGIKLLRPDVPIEFFFIRSRIEPKVIIGFDTTALFTLKGLFNQCEGLNIQIKSGFNINHPFQERYKNLLLEIGIPTHTLYI